MPRTGPEHTIIDCQGAARGFVIDSGEDSTLVIDGFTVRNGKAPVMTEYPYMENGGAVLVSGPGSSDLQELPAGDPRSPLPEAGSTLDRHCGIRLEGCTLKPTASPSSPAGTGVHGRLSVDRRDRQ